MTSRALLLGVVVLAAIGAAQPESPLDRDLLDVTVPKLQQLYADKTYTVPRSSSGTSIASIDTTASTARLRRCFAAMHSRMPRAWTQKPRQGHRVAHCGVFRSSSRRTRRFKGYPTTAGWEGFVRPGHELIAPQDATIVAKFKSAGAIVVGTANMPDLANSDTNRSTSFGRTGNAYDVRFSPGGSSGGIVTAVAANMAVLGNGTDTGNSIRMPAATSALVGVFPTRGLVSIAGIAPLDWLLDNTGPIARNATDAAIALSVMAGEDPRDQRTVGIPASAQRPPYASSLAPGALKGKRFGVPAFVLAGDGVPFHGIPTG
jgi:hypothetical protein